MAKRANGQTATRCAIYTRKSSEEGLEQDFNSLDAQRESCEAFILSGLASQKWRAPTETGGVLWDEESGLRRSSSARRFVWC